MMTRTHGVCGGRHRVALVAMRDEVARYWKTPLLIAGAVAAGAGLAVPALLVHRRLSVNAPAGGDLGLTWRSGVETAAVAQQQAMQELGVLLLGSALATLGIAAITILALCLARENERAAELVVRRAVGAGRRVLLGSATAEAAAISLVGLVAGGCLAIMGGLAAHRWPGSVAAGTPRIAVLAVLALVGMVLGGLAFPVLLPRRRLGEAEPRSPVPLLPSEIQIGGCLVALTMGTILGSHASAIGAGNVGLPLRGEVSLLKMAKLEPEKRSQEYAALLSALERDGHEMASLTSPGALVGLGPTSMVTTDCGQCSEGGIPVKWKVKAATHRFVSADTFEMMGLGVLQGRGITAKDAWQAPRVAVVSRSLAAREFQDGQAIGRRIRVVDEGTEWSTVVGIVDEPVGTALGAALQPRYAVYLSVLQHPPETVELLTLGAPRSGARRVEELLAREAAPLRWFAERFKEQGWGMLVVAVLGSLALARLWVDSLLVEFGVRRALGAPRRRIFGYVVGRAATVCGVGIAGGVFFGAVIWGILADLVAGLQPWDWSAVLRFGAALAVSTLLGALPPAWRASRATPASLLAA